MAVTKTCERCGKDFSVSPSRKNALYCSQSCYWQSMKGKIPNHPNCHPNQKTTHECKYCKSEFTLPPNKVKRSNRLFCSFECMGLANRQEPGKPYTKDDLECMYIRERMSFQQIADILDSSEWVIKRILKANGITFRNRQEWGEAAWKHADENRIDCAKKSGERLGMYSKNKSPEERVKTAVIGAAALRNRKGPTSIELKMMYALDRESINYIFQFPVGGKFLCDFKLSDHGIIIECDGIYWHSKPSAKNRDKSKNAYLHKCGYTVLRFTDKQIDGDIDACVKAIRDHIASGS